MTEPRDPRTHPEVGDVLRSRKHVFTVKDVHRNSKGEIVSLKFRMARPNGETVRMVVATPIGTWRIAMAMTIVQATEPRIMGAANDE